MIAKKKQGPDLGEGVESALSRTERFFEENQKIIIRVVTIILAAAAIFLGIKRFYLMPRDNEARSQMFVAEQYFETDSFNLALYGDGNYSGFIEIIDNYGLTKAANLCQYYAGISYLRLGEYEDAINYLKKFRSTDKMVAPVAEGAKGDAYVELGDMQKGLQHYLRAAGKSKNNFTTPIYLMKAAEVYEQLKEYGKAIDLYTRIKAEFTDFARNNNIDKYIARLQVELGK
jgi:tetratricopeptide (TPR) repeat protein